MPFLTAATFSILQHVPKIHRMTSLARAKLYGRLLLLRALPYLGVVSNVLVSAS